LQRIVYPSGNPKKPNTQRNNNTKNKTLIR